MHDLFCNWHSLRFLGIAIATLLVAACGGATSTSGSGSGGSATFTIGGTITGLSGVVVLQNNLGDDLTLSSNGGLAFATALADNADYRVTVLTQPTDQTCAMSQGAGKVSGRNVTNVTVVCAATTYKIGGTLSGLVGSVMLQNNAGDNLTLTSNGGFSFAIGLPKASRYQVSVLTHPTGYGCSLVHETGTVGTSDITDIAVTCTINSYALGGAVTHLDSGKQLVLQNNAAADLSISTNGNYTFATTVIYGEPYHVTVLTQPELQMCTAANAGGLMPGNSVADVAVDCTCAVGATQCGGAGCVNTVTDVLNCGACGTTCATGQVCMLGACVNACADGIKDGNETDVDCGGGSCAKCNDGKSCVSGSDCASTICNGGVCQMATCFDGVKNGTESDQDCGGICGACAAGMTCNANSDCMSGGCSGNVCN